MTANAMEGDRERYLAAGMDDYVSKPIRVQDLTQALKRAAASRRDHHKTAGQSHSHDKHHLEEFSLDLVALQNLSELVGDDEAFLQELIGTFLNDAPKLIADMNKAIRDNHAPALRLAAHTLKSNSADFGATVLSELSKKLEMMGRDEALDGAADLMPQVHDEFIKVESFLRDMLDKDRI
jgi:HPt (histidine-containing phosphotransfer) domain-containing protein